MTIKMILPRTETGWTKAIVNGRWVMAKVHDNPSRFGVNGGRVSKLSISKTDSYDPYKPFFRQMDYNYDRGLDFSNLDQNEVDAIVEELENLVDENSV